MGARAVPMRSTSRVRRTLAAVLAVALGGCGTVVPQVEEAYERKPDAKRLEVKIKEQIYCELRTAVQVLNNDRQYFINVGNDKKSPLPQSWGVAMTITLVIVENSAFRPGVSIISPKPSQSFTLGLGGTMSAEATRTDTYTFYYLIRDLQAISTDCALYDAKRYPYGRKPSDFEGSSLLLTSNLGIFDWLKTAIIVRDSRGVSAKSKQEVLSYNTKFDVVTSGSVTPSWSLERVRTGTDDLLSTKRERTHEMLLAFGPAEDQPKGRGAGQARPSQLLLNELLVSQLRSAFATGVRSTLNGF